MPSSIYLYFLLRTRNYIRGFVRPSVRPSDSYNQVEQWENKRFGYFLCMSVCGRGDWGLDRGWTPLPTRLQRYCDPASLVSFFLSFVRDFFLDFCLSSSYNAVLHIYYFPLFLSDFCSIFLSFSFLSFLLRIYSFFHSTYFFSFFLLFSCGHVTL